jgi:glycosyltransferase involved in cell wall biosynthesis
MDAMLAAARSTAWPEDVDLVVVGSIVDEGLRPALSSLPRNVHYLGPKPQAELPALIRGAIAALIPISNPGERSQTGVMPLKLFEALACGTPVIVSDLPGQAEFVRQNGCGLVFPVDDAAALARAVARLAADPAAARAQGEAGARLVQAQHSWEARAAQIECIISGLRSSCSAERAPLAQHSIDPAPLARRSADPRGPLGS